MGFLLGMTCVIFVATAVSAEHTKSETSETNEKKVTFEEWKAQIEHILKDTHAWKKTVETILAQFALAAFPKEFTPKLFAAGSVNDTVVLNQQHISLRSRVYHQAISTLDPTIKVKLPFEEGFQESIVHDVVRELQERGFYARYMKTENVLFMDKLIK